MSAEADGALSGPTPPKTGVDDVLLDLSSGQRHLLEDLPTLGVTRTTGIYALWLDDELLYVGISYREPATTSNPRARGVAGRLATYRQGSLTNEFVLAVMFRWVIPQLTPVELEQLSTGALAMAGIRARTRAWIRLNITFSAVGCTADVARSTEPIARARVFPGIQRHC